MVLLKVQETNLEDTVAEWDATDFRKCCRSDCWALKRDTIPCLKHNPQSNFLQNCGGIFFYKIAINQVHHTANDAMMMQKRTLNGKPAHTTSSRCSPTVAAECLPPNSCLYKCTCTVKHNIRSVYFSLCRMILHHGLTLSICFGLG